jgi:hypothetical protein
VQGKLPRLRVKLHPIDQRLQYAAQLAGIETSLFRLTEQIEYPATFAQLQTVRP